MIHFAGIAGSGGVCERRSSPADRRRSDRRGAERPFAGRCGGRSRVERADGAAAPCDGAGGVVGGLLLVHGHAAAHAARVSTHAHRPHHGRRGRAGVSRVPCRFAAAAGRLAARSAGAGRDRSVRARDVHVAELAREPGADAADRRRHHRLLRARRPAVSGRGAATACVHARWSNARDLHAVGGGQRLRRLPAAGEQGRRTRYQQHLPADGAARPRRQRSPERAGDADHAVHAVLRCQRVPRGAEVGARGRVRGAIRRRLGHLPHAFAGRLGRCGGRRRVHGCRRVADGTRVRARAGGASADVGDVRAGGVQPDGAGGGRRRDRAGGVRDAGVPLELIDEAGLAVPFVVVGAAGRVAGGTRHLHGPSADGRGAERLRVAVPAVQQTRR